VDELLDESIREEAGLNEWEALEAEAQFAHVLHGGRAVTADTANEPSEAEEEFLGLPGLLSPEQTAQLLHRRDSELRKRATKARRAVPDDDRPGRADPTLAADVAAQLGIADGTSSWRAAADLRREVNRLVSVLAARRGVPHAVLHAQLRGAVPGPASASASVELLESRRDYLMGEL
jgi:hypothetical protein